MDPRKFASRFAFLVGLFGPFVGDVSCQGLWQQPRSGWLYVLDAQGSSRAEAHVILVDPAAGASRGSITVGYAPQFVASSDGAKFIVVSGAANQGKATIYDARSGQTTAQADVPFRILYTTWPTDTTLALSHDGQWLYVETMQTIGDGSDVYGIQRFEVVGNSIKSAGHGSLPGCGVAEIVPLTSADWDLLVHCGLSNLLRLIRFDSAGTVSNIKDIALPVRPYDAASGQMGQEPLVTRAISYSGTGETLLALSGSNEVCRLDLQTGSSACLPLVNRMLGRWIPLGPWPRSPDGQTLYFGSGPVTTRSGGMATSIEVVNASTLALQTSISASKPFWSLAVGNHGSVLYAANPVEHTILQFDATTQKQVKEIALPGTKPAVIFPVP